MWRDKEEFVYSSAENARSVRYRTQNESLKQHKAGSSQVDS